MQACVGGLRPQFLASLAPSRNIKKLQTKHDNSNPNSSSFTRHPLLQNLLQPNLLSTFDYSLPRARSPSNLDHLLHPTPCHRPPTMSESDIGSQPTTPLPEAAQDAVDSDRQMSDAPDSAPGSAVASPKDLAEDNDLSDNESELSEVDEGEFADFDPTTVALEDRPLVDIDEDVARTLKAAKRKKTTDGEGKKAKEGKREKKKKRARDEDEDPDGQQLEGKRIRKPKSVRIEGDRKERERAKDRKEPSPENEENLTPEERRRRALDRAMDAALKNPNKRRRKKDEVVCSGFRPCDNISNYLVGPGRSIR